MRFNHPHKVAAEHDLSSGGAALSAAISEGERIDNPQFAATENFCTQ